MHPATVVRLLYTSLICVTSNIFCSSDDSWANNAHVIRLKCNQSNIRTMFLPKFGINITNDRIKKIGTKIQFEIPRCQNSSLMFIPTADRNITDGMHKLRQIFKKQFGNVVLKNNHYPLPNYFKIKKNKIQSNNASTVSSKLPKNKFKVNASKVAKWLNPFTIVNFTNSLCYTPGGRVGTCYHPQECKELAGQEQGICAQGFGVCCFVQQTCGESIIINNSYFTVTGIEKHPETGVYICTVLIQKHSPEVQQLRLSFHTFELAGPVDGSCTIDRFLVTGQNSNDIIPPICGFNTGKHIYVDVDNVTGPVALTVLSSGAHGVPKNIKILVTQLKKQDISRGPNNCLQYFTEASGEFESFNYIPFNSASSSTTPGYFNNQNYAICFKKLPGYCGISYTNLGASGMEYIFELVNVENNGIPTVPEGQAGAEVFDCPDDYIVVDGIRLCGYKLNDASTIFDYTKNAIVSDDTNGPLVLKVYTNSNVTGRGFHLEYSLTPCNISKMIPSSQPT